MSAMPDSPANRRPVVKGWCPGALRPMASGDGLVVRVRPPLALLTPEQASGLADLAQAQGSGILQLTNRANLQIRGVTEAQLSALQDGLVALGLLDPSLDPLAEARLNILVAPGWSGQGTPALWTALRQALAAKDAPRLPGKFGFALDVSGQPCLQTESADIRIESAQGRVVVRADGSALGRSTTPGQAVDLVLKMARWFAFSGGIGPDGRGRMRDHLARGAVLPPALAGDTAPDEAGARPATTGFDFGLIEAPALRHLARNAGGNLHLTPWRGVHLPGAPDLAALQGDPAFLLNPAAPRHRRFACTGVPGCPQAIGPTRDLGLLPPPGKTLHISGCAKGCAHPGPADLTLTWTASGIAVIPGGRACDPAACIVPPAALAATLKEWTHAASV
ncbi:MAG: precorrin-3B synthase [Pseudotabrizicola sp.]|uniref:precorrin-3B synthase n=1 Tax=Pseudotabrizicola sp. TaxID=2939647 RepID=UPI00272136D3|nr:precorrin-3B synthase [Pseudotabrizicola sp.]MDO9638438.1 precorrin-3B synthase [Pseudotabrizicola sp.]